MTRTFADIAAGLAPAREARPIRPGERIHIVGIGGSASVGAALAAHAAGADVTGCDTGGASPYTAEATAVGISISWSHDPGHVVDAEARPQVDRIAVTKALTSVHPDHPELLAARDAGIPAESVQQVIADAAATHGQRLVGVTGTHGKSTTTGWVTHLLAAAGRDPSAFVGALLPTALTGALLPTTTRIGQGREFVVEADEYAGNFDPYRAWLGAVVSAEWDHPDVFADREDVVETLASWVRRFGPAPGDGEAPVLVANAGDPGVQALLEELEDWDGRRVLVDLLEDPAADLAAHRRRLVERFGRRPGSTALVGRIVELGVEGEAAEILGPGIGGSPAPALIRTPLLGRHMLVDGLVALATALACGGDPARLLPAFGTFHGVGRRMELKGDVGGVVVLDDYGHHPTAMRLTFAAVRQRYPGRRLWAVYEPLTYHRTAAMLDAFAEVLATAERAAIVDIWAVRDPDTTIVSAADLASAIEARGTPAVATGSPESSAEALASVVEPGDVVLVMGGGRSYVTAEELVERLRERAERPTGR
ncbi:MAG TPA: cyanophycin synthetase [Candidatus Limnocylindrales bacterium]|nr:cyanophycin synthetase [Candidatus Limnocylindrales bacterium]